MADLDEYFSVVFRVVICHLELRGIMLTTRRKIMPMVGNDTHNCPTVISVDVQRFGAVRFPEIVSTFSLFIASSPTGHIVMRCREILNDDDESNY